MSNTFEHLGLPEQIMAALKRMSFTTPTQIQSRTIPVAMQGRDILGSAQTGTGKTAAFCIPMIAKLMEDDNAMGLVVTPTRELAAQILTVVHALTANNRAMRTALLIGGDSMGKQFGQLRERPRLIVGTPGRINDHLRRDPKMLSKVVFVAIDEADRMLDMGFSVQLDEILKTLPRERQTLMFSATFPDAIIKFSRSYLNNPERIAVNPESVTVPKIKHEMKRTTDATKYTDLLAELVARDGSVIIFAKTQHGTDRLAKRLEADNHGAVAIHGGLRQNQREKAVREFRSQRFRILVATDVASRGLDIPHIEHVINYDLPQVAEDYIHRIGRTARAGAEGNAMAFVLPSDGQMWNAINRIMNPDAPHERFERGGESRANRGHRGSGGGFGSGNRSGSGGGYKGKSSGGYKGGREDNKFPSREGRSFGGERSARPQSDKPQGDKPFVKYYNKDGNSNASNHGAANRDRKPNDGNWNNKEGRARYNPNDGKFEQPRAEGRGDGRQGNERFSNERSAAPRRDDRNGNTAPKPFYKKDDRAGNFRADRPAGGDRNHRYDGKPAFKKDDRSDRPSGFKAEGNFKSDAPRKPRSDKPAGKKPFQFKAHDRKGGKSGVAPKDRAAV